jgi:hypothetical protein
MTRTCAVAACLFLLLTICHAGFGQKVNEPEMLVNSARLLEQRPLDKQAKDIRSWAITWLIQTDKVSVTVCSLVVSGVDKKYKYQSEIFGQYTIGMAAFKLTQPDKAKDEDAAQLAGIESALLAYEAIVKEQPKAKNSFMDGLISKRSDGSLAKFVLENNCKGSK